MRRRALDWISDLYEVSEDGRVFSYVRRGKYPARMPLSRELKQDIDVCGYARVRLPWGNGFRKVRVHRIVLRAFTGVDGVQCNHKNGIRLDNRLSNLEWCSASENMAHSYKVLGRAAPKAMLGRTGELSPFCKPVIQTRVDGKVVKVWGSAADAALHGFNQGNISTVCNGKRRTHAGYVWQFVSQQGK